MVLSQGPQSAEDVVKDESYDGTGEHHLHHHHRHHHEERRQHELRAHRIISAVTAFFTLATFVLFLLVGIGSPIIKSVWLLTLEAKPFDPSIVTSIATQIRFGTWGYCAVGEDGSQRCFGPRLGYSLTNPVNIAGYLNEPSLTNAITQGLTFILVLHPICAALALVLFVTCWIQRHAAAIGALVVAIVLAVVGSASLAIDLALVIIAHDRVPAATGGDFDVVFANGVWMVLVAVICAWASVITISIRACLCCGLRTKF